MLRRIDWQQSDGNGEPVDDAEVIKAICRSAKQYNLSLCCPAEMWANIADVLINRDVDMHLAQIPADIRTIMRSAYHERPGSLQSAQSDRLVLLAIERWLVRETVS